MNDTEFAAKHEGHAVIWLDTVAKCEDCDVFHTTDAARELGDHR